MEEGLLAVWPDLGTIRADLVLREVFGEGDPPRFLDRDGSYIEGLVGADGTSGGTAQVLVRGVPWEPMLEVHLGPTSKVGPRPLAAHRGPNAVEWLSA